MAYWISEDVMWHAPAELGSNERLALITLGIICRNNNRRVSIESRKIQQATGMKPGALKAMFKKLEGRGYKVREELGTDRNGNRYTAMSGTCTTYVVPTFDPPEGCDCNLCEQGITGPNAGVKGLTPPDDGGGDGVNPLTPSEESDDGDGANRLPPVGSKDCGSGVKRLPPSTYVPTYEEEDLSPSSSSVGDTSARARETASEEEGGQVVPLEHPELLTSAADALEIPRGELHRVTAYMRSHEDVGAVGPYLNGIARKEGVDGVRAFVSRCWDGVHGVKKPESQQPVRRGRGRRGHVPYQNPPEDAYG